MSPRKVMVVCASLGVGGGTTVAPRAAAQVNIEAQRGSDADSGLSGSLATEIELRTGNVERFDLSLQGRVDYRTGATTTFIVGRGTLGLVGGDRFNNAGLVHLRNGWLWRPRFVPEVYAQVNYDEPRLLEFRSVVGGGARVGLTQTDGVRVWVGTGYMFEHERLDVPDSAMHDRTASVHRLSSYVTGSLSAGPRAGLVATTYVQPKFTDFADVRILSEVSLGVAVAEAVSVTLRFTLRYDGRPPDGVASLDTALRNGITVRF